MGAGASKPEASAGSKHIFASETPVQFSANLVEALQSSKETDSSRAKSLELHIQARVAEELERLRQREKQTLEEIEKRVAAELPDRKVFTAPASSPSYAAPAGSLDLDAPRIPFAGREFDAPLFPIDPATVTPPQASQPQSPAVVDPSREAVLKDIERLRSKLESRKKLATLDDNVEQAKSEVVNCLRINDRRPLDCWKEVESFKQEVAKLERAFVDKVVG
ncbi:conserved hypothetical protein [Talaromyces stipitatus ATCC 10500]|uniref:DUF1690 domain protein n=1 Tax=Talaromyces stipitatus (strain ATCC 10500 / CBS 375.48 / QM 6759 / NRRL 1006) TaxID=441959 RepID=B8M4R8_TALSN|nr:uncharacterized protein TSTA_026600 [Talaromyces stipitatus ATCC 10500]EED19353.1 conserved hypothetical protein [Talaromyces stipitatus ATCC 10500]